MPQGKAATRVVAAVVRRDNRLLVCRRPVHKHYGGLWEFPGGKVAADERDEDALARELREELGVILVSASPAEFEAADPHSAFVIAFATVTISGEPSCLEHSELAWAAPSELQRFSLAPTDTRYVEWLLKSDNAVA